MCIIVCECLLKGVWLSQSLYVNECVLPWLKPCNSVCTGMLDSTLPVSIERYAKYAILVLL